MATAETVDMGPPHAPKEDTIEAFNKILPELKKTLFELRRDHDKHEPEYFAAVAHLDTHQLTNFSAEDIHSVRVANSAYGIHLLTKVRLPELPANGPAYIHVRIFICGDDDEPVKLHSIHTEEREDGDGGKSYRAIFNESDELEWFDT